MYRSILIASFLGLLGAALGCAAFAVMGSQAAQRELARTQAARVVLEAHLELEASVFTLFKQLADEILSDDGLVDPDIAEAQGRVAERLGTTRRLIAAEVALAGRFEDETDDLARLAEIEEIVRSVFADLRAADEADADRAEPVLADVLERLIDSDLRRLIDAAVREERGEVAAAEASAAATLERVAALSKLAALAAALVCAGGLALLIRRLRRPLAAFEAATSAAAAGDLARRIPDLGSDEFGAVGRRFNEMLAELEMRRSAAETAQADLAAAVEARTAELASANDRLSRSDDLRRRFLADISHELRTPLTIIRGEAEVTLRARTAADEDYRGALGRIAEQAAHTARLVDDLLFVARTEAGEPRMTRSVVSLADLARRVVGEAGLPARERGLDLALSATAEGAVLGDAGRLRQLLMILIDNAIRYSPAGGRVTVSVDAGPQGAYLRVGDQGVGIPVGDLPRIFDRFHRGANAVALNLEGSGLGLAMAKTIAEAHGGAISVESRVGDGSVFTARFPALGPLRSVA